LASPIANGGDAQRPRCAAPLVDVPPQNRGRLEYANLAELALFQRVRKLFVNIRQQGLQRLRQNTYDLRNAIDSGSHDSHGRLRTREFVLGRSLGGALGRAHDFGAGQLRTPGPGGILEGLIS